MEGILGTDISKWDDDPNTAQKIDFVKMKNAGAKYVIFKATQGKSLIDRVFTASWKDASGLIRGAYHFLDWGSTATQQATHFCNQLATVTVDLPPIVDYEYRTGVPSKAEAVAALQTFVNYVESHTGRVPMIYTSPSFWQEYGSKAVSWQKYPLWIANYKVTKPAIPIPWTKYHLWQYTDAGDGTAFGVETKEVDLNVFNGTYNELRIFANLPIVPTPVFTDAEKLERLWNAHPELHE